jgi:hypothetical protein
MLIFSHDHECLLEEALPKTSYPFEELTSIKDFEELTSRSNSTGVELTFSIKDQCTKSANHLGALDNHQFLSYDITCGEKSH